MQIEMRKICLRKFLEQMMGRGKRRTTFWTWNVIVWAYLFANLLLRPSQQNRQVKSPRIVKACHQILNQKIFFFVWKRATKICTKPKSCFFFDVSVLMGLYIRHSKPLLSHSAYKWILEALPTPLKDRFSKSKLW